jgi:hypothetical protein
MATDILTIVDPDFEAEPNPRDEMENLLRALVRQLELDGYVFRKNKLYPFESSVIDEQREQTYLDALVDTLNLPEPATIKHHMGLSEEHYVNKKWDDSISNSRKVLDATLSQVATNVYLKVKNKPIPSEMLKNATDLRLFLEREGLLTKQERELLDTLR